MSFLLEGATGIRAALSQYTTARARKSTKSIASPGLPRYLFLVNALYLLKSLAPGFIPLFVYIAAELLFGEIIGLAAGLAIGVIEFAYSFAKEKKADPFIAADTLLLAAMGSLSLLLQNPLFFRLKPAVIEGVLAVALSFLLFLPPRTLKSYLGHQVRGFVLEDSGLPALRRSLILMVSVMALHVGLTIWAALVASTALWGFVSGGLLYIMLGAAIAGQWLILRRRGAERGSPFRWRLLILDETGRIYAAKTQGNGVPSMGLWDSPAGGESAGSGELGRELGVALSRLGLGDGRGGPGYQPALSPVFIIDPEGKITHPPAESSLATLAGSDTAMGAGAELVLVARFLSPAFPRGIDPTERRLFSLADLVALAGEGKLTPAFARVILALSSLRHPLRAEAAASIVSDTNDAAV